MQSHSVVPIRTSTHEFGREAGQPVTADIIKCLSQTRVNESALHDTMFSPVDSGFVPSSYSSLCLRIKHSCPVDVTLSHSSCFSHRNARGSGVPFSGRNFESHRAVLSSLLWFCHEPGVSQTVLLLQCLLLPETSSAQLKLIQEGVCMTLRLERGKWQQRHLA